MQIRLGEQLKELRRQYGRTQEDLAKALDITPQAVSRWEKGLCYPDMQLIPAIANYFQVTIDELFGYQNDRDEKVDKLLEEVESFHMKARSDSEWVDDCLTLLRSGLAEFPQNEKLRVALADILTEAGWRLYQERLYYDEEGYIRHDYAYHQKNGYWREAVEICEGLVTTARDSAIVIRANSLLALLYKNLGEREKALAAANHMPQLENCRELLLAAASDGKEQAEYIGLLLLEMTRVFSRQLVYGLMTNISHYKTDMGIEKLKGAIALFQLICEDGNMGKYHDDLISLYLYLSRLQWERGYCDDAFLSLDQALHHAHALEAVGDGAEHSLTAPLVSFVTYRVTLYGKIARELPDDWPFWHSPNDKDIEAGIKADPRWDRWVEKCRAE